MSFFNYICMIYAFSRELNVFPTSYPNMPEGHRKSQNKFSSSSFSFVYIKVFLLSISNSRQ